MCPVILFAATVEISWNANTEADMASYNVYQGNTLIGSVNHPTTLFDILNVPDGSYTYYLTAVDTSGNESIKSDALNFFVNTKPPDKPTGLKARIKN
jgi:fibronectin type 3 domain-containing protein